MVMELPKSTPNVLIQHDFGIGDLHLDIIMEKIILAVQVIKLNDNRIVKRLLRQMLKRKVEGFCTEVVCDLKMLGLDDLYVLSSKDNIRKYLKKEIIEINKKVMQRKMLAGTKSTMVLTKGFNFDGKVKKYLTNLPFREARAVFMVREHE